MPAFGGLTIRARWPLPIGLTMLTSRWLRFLGSDSRLSSSIGWIGVRSAKCGRRRAVSGIDAVDGVDAQHPPVLLALARSADGAADAIADAEPEATDLAGADVDVVGPGHEAVPAEEPVALVDDVEDAGHVGLPEPLGLDLEDRVDEVVAALDVGRLDLELLRRGAELGGAHVAQLGRADLRAFVDAAVELVDLGEAGGAAALGAAARTPVAGALRIGSVGHGERGHLRGVGPRGRRDGRTGAESDPRRRCVWDERSIRGPRGPRQRVSRTGRRRTLGAHAAGARGRPRGGGPSEPNAAARRHRPG